MQRFRFAWAWTVGVVLAAAPAAAQTPIIEVVSGGTTLRGEIADFPPCLAGKPRLIYALDGANATDCTVGGGVVEVLCSCEDAGYAAVGGGPAALDDLSDVTTGGAIGGDALVSDGAGAWSPGVPSIAGAAGVAAEPQLFDFSGDPYTRLEADCIPSGAPGGPLMLDCRDGVGYSIVLEEGTPLTDRGQVDFIGASITCADNSGLGRTECTLTDADTAAGYTFSGNGAALVTTTGAQTAGDCVTIDASGNHVASGAACGGGGVPIEIEDADQDTGCEVERTADSDTLVCRTAGGDRLSLSSTGVLTITRATGAAPGMRVLGGATGSAQANSGEICTGHGGSSLETCLGYDWNSNTGWVRAKNNSDRLLLGSGGSSSTLELRADGNAVHLKGVRLTPQASPPWVCTVAGDNGREYIDDSGARCTCWGATWIMTHDLSGSGSCV